MLNKIPNFIPKFFPNSFVFYLRLLPLLELIEWLLLIAVANHCLLQEMASPPPPPSYREVLTRPPPAESNTGASLVNRILVSNPLKQRSAAIALPQISSNPYSLHSLLQKLQIDRITPPLQESPPVGGDAETLRRIASPDGVFFPCGLPYLRFFIGEGDDALSNDPLLLLPRRTNQPSHIKRKRTHGYLARRV